MDTSTPAQNRRSRRSSVLLAATLRTRAGGTLPVKLRNLSAEGALVEADNLPIEGSQVVFEREELSVRGRIVWVHGGHAGIAFNYQLPPEQVLRNVPKPRPQVQPEFRRPGLACRSLNEEERRLVESWVWAPRRSRPGE